MGRPDQKYKRRWTKKRAQYLGHARPLGAFAGASEVTAGEVAVAVTGESAVAGQKVALAGKNKVAGEVKEGESLLNQN